MVGSAQESTVTEIGNVFDAHDELKDVRTVCEHKGLMSQLTNRTTRQKFNERQKKNKSNSLRRDRIMHQNSYFLLGGDNSESGSESDKSLGDQKKSLISLGGQKNSSLNR